MNSLEYIIRRVSSEAGFASPTLDVAQRALLVDVINMAAKEVYDLDDIPTTLQECFIRSMANKELALPPFIGEIRAIRPGCTDYCTKWELHDVMPRYVQSEWKTQWTNWRLKGYVPIAIEWLNTAPGTITYPVADATLTITVVGKTENSNRAVDIVTMDDVQKSWTKTFLQIDRIYKNKVTDYDAIVSDAADDEASVIYADQLDARYLLVDVSEFPEFPCCACDDGTYIMQVLYKPRLARMEEDSDAFPVDGCEDLIVLATKRLLAEMQEGKEDRALLMHAKEKQLVKNISKNKTGTFQRQLSFKRNPFYGHFR